MESKIKELISKYIKNQKIRYEDLNNFSEETKNEIIEYCSSNNIEIIYDQNVKGNDFYQSIRAIRVLTKEEVELLTLAQQGNEEAKNKMIEHNLRLVLSNIPILYPNQTLDEDDLFQAGCLGLYKAIEKFDISSGNKFSTYATYWISQSMQRTMENQSRTIRIPVARNNTFKQIKKFEDEFYMLHGYYPTPEIIKENLGIEEYIVRELRTYENAPTSLESRLINDDEKNGAALGEMIEDEFASTEETAIENVEPTYLIDIIEQDPKTSERNKELFKSRYGLDGTGYKTLEEVGELFGVTRERVRQIEKKCLKRYQLLLKMQGITDCKASKTPIQRVR